jgi:hypothetical protein
MIGCVTAGLAASREIQCLLRGGSDIEHEPTIIVTGYDWVQPFTRINISIANVVQLSTTLRNTVFVSVVIKQLGSWKEGYLYNPEQLTLKQTYPLSTTAYSSVSVGYFGMNEVGKPTTFQLTVTPSVDVTTYFVLKFPTDFLHNSSGLFAPACAQAARVDVFYRSDVVRVYPLNGVHLAGISVTYNISGFPSTQYVMPAANWPILIEAYSGYRQVHRKVVNMGFYSVACVLPFTILTVSSPYAFEQSVNFTFEIGLNSSLFIQTDQSTLAIEWPAASPSLLSDDVSCQVEVPLTCLIASSHTILISNLDQYY